MKAMLACSTIPKLDQIRYPVIATPKLDGVRCIAKDGVALSRTMKVIPNRYIQEVFKELDLHGLDGELMVHGDFNEVQSAVMSVNGTPNFTYNVFDYWVKPHLAYSERLLKVDRVLRNSLSHHVDVVQAAVIDSAEEMQAVYDGYIAMGYEGAIVRDPSGPYKLGRSTLNQGYMLKLKPSMDDEAVIIGFKELMRNMDTSTKRQENMVGANTLGALQVNYKGVLFDIGSGFDDLQRKRLWDMRFSLTGTLVKFKYQELTANGVPRFPVFLGLRDVGS